jgi:DNA-directed RNA polymerase specialized sigma24 family protein
MPSTYDDPVYLAQLRRDLLRFARLQLRDADASEDAVQEALAAAWSHAGDFADGPRTRPGCSGSCATSWSTSCARGSGR